MIHPSSGRRFCCAAGICHDGGLAPAGLAFMATSTTTSYFAGNMNPALAMITFAAIRAMESK